MARPVPPWVREKGFSTWKSYMASIRPEPGKRRRRKRKNPGYIIHVERSGGKDHYYFYSQDEKRDIYVSKQTAEKLIRQEGGRVVYNEGHPSAKRKNPGARWHRQEAMIAKERGFVSKSSHGKSFYRGKFTAHAQSADKSGKEGLNPKRRNPKSEIDGYFVWGKHTSVSWHKRKEDAEKEAKQMNYRGGTHYTVVPSYKPEHPKNPIAIYNPSHNGSGRVIYSKVYSIVVKAFHPDKGNRRHTFDERSGITIKGLPDGSLLLKPRRGLKLWYDDKKEDLKDVERYA